MGRNSSRVGELATRLKEIRLSKGLTQEEMSYKVGTTAQFISCLENGIKTPSLTMIFKICDGLEVEPSDLFKLTKLKTKPKKKAFYEKIDAVLLRASDHELRAIYKMIKLFLNEWKYLGGHSSSIQFVKDFIFKRCKYTENWPSG